MMPKLPPISSDDVRWMTYNANTDDVIDWIQRYTIMHGREVLEACAVIIDERIDAARKRVAASDPAAQFFLDMIPILVNCSRSIREAAKEIK